MEASSQVRELSQRLVEQGAVMAVSGSPATYHLVGAWRWEEAPRVMWFVAHGDSDADAHVLEFDRVQAVEGLGICFLQGDQLAGYLSPIESAEVEDPEDYRIGWEIWKEVAPLYGPLIERAFERRLASLDAITHSRSRRPARATIAAA